jgi:hypothetical protein
LVSSTGAAGPKPFCEAVPIDNLELGLRALPRTLRLISVVFFSSLILLEVDVNAISVLLPVTGLSFTLLGTSIFDYLLVSTLFLTPSATFYLVESGLMKSLLRSLALD